MDGGLWRNEAMLISPKKNPGFACMEGGEKAAASLLRFHDSTIFFFLWFEIGSSRRESVERFFSFFIMSVTQHDGEYHRNQFVNRVVLMSMGKET